MKILFVEDDKKYQNIIKELLELEGYKVDTAENVADALQLFKKKSYELIITDFEMKDVDGLQFVTLAKKIRESVRVIVLTGVEDPELEIRSLNMDVADFIKKPVDFNVLLKRIEIALRTQSVVRDSKLESKDCGITVDTKRRLVRQNGERIELTVTEYNLLVFLLQNKNVVQQREKILDKVWRGNASIDIRAVDTHVKNLRAKLDISCIYSIRGIGYEWVEEN